MAKSKVLLVEDTESLARLYMAYLVPLGLEITWVATGTDAISKLENEIYEIVLLDIMLPDISGIKILEHINQETIQAQVIVLTAHGTKDMVMTAMRLGAADFLEKPVDAERVRVTVNNALKVKTLTKEVDSYKQKYEKNQFCNLIGSSTAMQSVYQIIRNVSPSTATVFITGESGTGKELTAQAVHECSGRKGEFVALNCAAIPKDLIESEIFGHVKGAFTGATSNRNGAAGQAKNGTLFLDEICEMDLNLQSKLLRFIQTGTFQRVGSDKLEKAEVRFVCATNRDPLLEVQAGRFREDLYYRLHVIPIQLPPLRMRDKDVIEIADYLFSKFAQQENKAYKKIEASCQNFMQTYPWPGNIRELENTVRSILVMHHSDVITTQMLPIHIQQNNTNPAVPVLHSEVEVPQSQVVNSLANQVNSPHSNHNTEVELSQAGMNLNAAENYIPRSSPASLSNASIGVEINYSESSLKIQPLWVNEKIYIEAVIEACGGNIPKASKLLEVSPSTIYRKIKGWEEMA